MREGFFNVLQEIDFSAVSVLLCSTPSQLVKGEQDSSICTNVKKTQKQDLTISEWEIPIGVRRQLGKVNDLLQSSKIIR